MLRFVRVMASAIRLLVHANVPAASLGPIVVSPARGTTVVSYVLPMVRAQVLGSVRAPQASRAMHASTHARGMLMVSFVAARVRVRIRWPGPSVYARHLTSARAAPRLRMATSWSPRVAPVWRVSALVVQRLLALGKGNVFRRADVTATPATSATIAPSNVRTTRAVLGRAVAVDVPVGSTAVAAAAAAGAGATRSTTAASVSGGAPA
jgi:hypothetical protein